MHFGQIAWPLIDNRFDLINDLDLIIGMTRNPNLVDLRNNQNIFTV